MGLKLHATALLGATSLLVGCPLTPPASNGSDFANRSDPTNGGAGFVGSAACVECHADVALRHARTGHANVLTPILGDGPRFAADLGVAPIAAAPDSFDWIDIPWMLGGARKSARFFGADGFFLTTGATGVATQYERSGAPDGGAAGYVEFEPDRTAPLPFDFATFRRFTTGPEAQDADDPRFFESRPGFQGVWAEAGVQCEACHGPGDRHFAAEGPRVEIERAAIFVDPDGAATCNVCHSADFDAAAREIRVRDGFIAPFQQATELQASGAHAAFACGVCHASHDSVSFSRDVAIRNECAACHVDVNMALHDGAIFRRADGYEEPLTCESCHMSYGVKQYAAGAFGDGAAGDTRTHLFRISTEPETFAQSTTSAGFLRRDAAGRAALTVDRVCLRCHNDAVDGLFSLSAARAAEIAPNLHVDFTLQARVVGMPAPRRE